MEQGTELEVSLLRTRPPKDVNRTQHSFTWRVVSTVMLIVFPLMGVLIFLCVPLSGRFSDDVYVTQIDGQWVPERNASLFQLNTTKVIVQKPVYSFYYLGIYYATTYYMPVYVLGVLLYPLPPLGLFFSGLAFIALTTLVFQFVSFDATSLGYAQFGFVVIGFLLYQLIVACIDVFHRCRLRRLRARNWGIASGTNLLIMALYLISTMLVQAFRTVQSDATLQSVYSVIFQVGGWLQRFGVFRLAQMHPSHNDRESIKPAYIFVFISQLVYFMFYRVIFTEFSSVTPFIVSQVTASVLEIFIYVVMMTQWAQTLKSRLIAAVLTFLETLFASCGCLALKAMVASAAKPESALQEYGLSEAAASKMTSEEREVFLDEERQQEISRAAYLEEKRYAALHPGITREELTATTELFRATCTEYMLRHLANLFSILNYVFLSYFLVRVPYLVPYYTPLAQFDGEASRGLMFIFIAAGVDVVLIVIVSCVWKFSFRRSLWVHWWSFLKRPSFAHYAIIFLASFHVGLDLVVSSANVSKWLFV